MPKRKGDKMILISLHVPQSMLEKLDELVRDGVFPSRSEAIRHALRELLLYYRDVNFKERPRDLKPQKEDLPEEMEILEGR